MKKYNAITYGKAGHPTTGDTVICMDEFQIYDPIYIQNFGNDRSRDLTLGPLTTHSSSNYAIWSSQYQGIYDMNSIAPLYAFQDANSFANKLVNLIRMRRGCDSNIMELERIG